jgi:hypothetical protein
VREQLIKAEDYGIEKSIAKNIEAAFLPSVEAMEAIKPEYDAFMEECGTGEPTEETIEKAKELRLKIVKIRTGTAKTHKEQKAPFYQIGKFIDALKNQQEGVSKIAEGSLKFIETYPERKEEIRLQGLQREREEEIDSYLLDGENHTDYAGMPGPVWPVSCCGRRTVDFLCLCFLSSIDCYMVQT